jgi:D-proline reductase (dithiol) PrdB
MVRLAEMPAVARDYIGGLEMPEVKNLAWTAVVPASERRISIVSTAGISRRDDKPFSWHARNYRVIAKDERDLVMTHVAVDYDRTAWQQDLNAIFPLDRLDEMARDGEIGSVADEHYSFMGATDPVEMETSAREVAARMRQEGVNTVFLIPV